MLSLLLSWILISKPNSPKKTPQTNPNPNHPRSMGLVAKEIREGLGTRLGQQSIMADGDGKPAGTEQPGKS